MPENTPATGTAEVSAPATDDFAAWETQRNAELSGKVPDTKPKEKSSEAAGDENKPDDKEAKTAPNSEAENKQEQTEGEDGEEKPKAKGGFQRKIDKLTRERYQLEGRLQELERQLVGKPAEQPAKEVTPANDGKPKLEQFENLEDYTEALVDWKTEQRAQRAQAESWAEKSDAARDKYEDFDDVLANRELKLSAAMQAVIFDSPHGADLAYELGKNPREAERIYKLSPVAAARELLKIEAKFTEPQKPTPEKKPKASAAPEPIQPISATNSSSHDPYGLGDADFEKFEKVRTRELRGA